MNFAFVAAVVVCSVEGLLGIILNLWLFYSLVRSKRGLMERMYRVPIYVSSVQNLLLCLLVATMNFVHVFREGTFVSAMFGPLAQALPARVFITFQIALVLTTMMWTLIPVTASLQLIGLSRVTWTFWKRIAASFIFTIICVVDVAFFSADFVPSPQFTVVLEGIVRDLYGIDKDFRVVTVGSTGTFTDINNGRSLITLLLYLVLAPYILSYGLFVCLVVLIRRRITEHGVTLSGRTLRLQRAFHIMQLLQGFLPLAIISIPALVFVIGALTQTNMDFATLIFTLFLWICPAVQAGVQLRFVRQSNARSPDSTRTGTSARRRASANPAGRRESEIPPERRQSNL